MDKRRLPWHISKPQAYAQLKTDVKAEYRTLHFEEKNGYVLLHGSLPILDIDGGELDRFQVEIVLDEDFPDTVPIVRETGGKIPRIRDRHINQDGTACLFVRDETWKYWNATISLTDFIKGPIHQFFLGQVYFSEHGEWPFGQRSHFGSGVAEYYFEELDTSNLFVVRHFLQYLAAEHIQKDDFCYCGSFQRLRHCHFSKLVDMRGKIRRQTAELSLKSIEGLCRKQNDSLRRKRVTPEIRLAKSIGLTRATTRLYKLR